MSTRSSRIRPSASEPSPPRSRKGVSPPRSPARNRKSSPARSPSRKSPARKSPSRKPTTKIPAPKSPSRPNKEVNNAQKSPSKRAAIKRDVEIKLVDLAETGIRTRRSDYSIKDLSSLPRNESNGIESALDQDVYGLKNRKSIDDFVPRRSTRIQEILENDVKRSSSKSVSKSITFSDEDSEGEIKLRKSKTATRNLATPIRESISRFVKYSGKWEFGGRFGSAILIVLLPAVVLSILLSCSKSCSVNDINLASLKSLSVWFSTHAALTIIAQIILQAGLACLPNFMNSGKFSINGMSAYILTSFLISVLDYFKIWNSSSILNDYIKLSTSAYLFATLLALVLFVQSRKLNENARNSFANTGYVLYDFWMGRQIHPRFGKLNFKLWIYRICCISTLILTVTILKKTVNIPQNLTIPQNVTLRTVSDTIQSIRIQPTGFIFTMMQLIYTLNFILREHKITTNFFWNYEGLGYMQLVSSALYPFYFTSVSKFIVQSGLELSKNYLSAASILFLIGFVIMSASNNIKHLFRTNPADPSMTNLESMPTFHGKKLLISGLWAHLRHPNYTGDILIHTALALPGLLTKNYILAAPGLLTILVLLHRAWRDHARCQRRYSAAWQRYCKRVPSVLLPKIL